MNKVVLRQHQGRSFFYTHAVCMQAGKFYQTVPLADIAPDAVCVECWELLHDEVEEEWSNSDDVFIVSVETQAEAKPLKYIRFGRNSWVHIASGVPFLLVAGRYGRWSKTLCGHLYERDDYTKVENVEYAESKLCKRCAQQKRLTLRGPDVDLGYERAVK